MFNGDNFVGFIIHGVDSRNETRIAFNTGTGVIPAYWGRKIIKSVYEYAFIDLEKRGIKKILLEVITKNTVAIHLYNGLGFEICRKYKCFKGDIKNEITPLPKLLKVDKGNVVWENLPDRYCSSWDNQRESILNRNDSFFQIIYREKVESYFVINSKECLLVQFDLLNNEEGSW